MLRILFNVGKLLLILALFYHLVITQFHLEQGNKDNNFIIKVKLTLCFINRARRPNGVLGEWR